ncbi:ATP-binding protein, partial [Streptomyces acidiscabies]
MESYNVWTCADTLGTLPAPRRGRTVDGRLLGRASELADLRAALAARRLVTVTGAAGVGKSRLARAAAGSGAVVWVGESGEGRLAERVVRAVRTPEHSPAHATARPDPVAALRALPAPHPLLVLDGVDPVHTECVGLVQRLLMDVPTLRVLVTARRALGLGEEHVLKLGTLGLRGPAVELFLDRARTATGHELRSDDLAAAQRICRLLEGVPLAIELAASQLTRHSVTDLAARLERDQCWLTGPHPGPRRRRSLRDAVGAGYRLCERESRVVWARASVFTGSFTEATAVFVCSGAGVEPHQVPGMLAQLAASGVLETLGEPGGVRLSRYRMTRAARDFGAERLREAGESTVAYERHALHYRRVAAVAENLWTNGQQRQAVRLVREEYDDLTALVRHAHARPGHVEAALETVVDLWFWWAVHGHAAQGRAHLRRLLPLAEPGSPLLPR